MKVRRRIHVGVHSPATSNIHTDHTTLSPAASAGELVHLHVNALTEEGYPASCCPSPAVTRERPKGSPSVPPASADPPRGPNGSAGGYQHRASATPASATIPIRDTWPTVHTYESHVACRLVGVVGQAVGFWRIRVDGALVILECIDREFVTKGTLLL